MLSRGGSDLAILNANGLISKLLGLLRVAPADPQEADPDVSQQATAVDLRPSGSPHPPSLHVSHSDDDNECRVQDRPSFCAASS